MDVGFDHDRAEAQARDDSIALRKRATQRRHARRLLTQHGAALSNFLCQSHMFRRINLTEAAAKHGDRSPTSCERAAMSRRIDAASQTADHGITRSRQSTRQSFSLLQAIRSGV